jgi:hypothetical protein
MMNKKLKKRLLKFIKIAILPLWLITVFLLVACTAKPHEYHILSYVNHASVTPDRGFNYKLSADFDIIIDGREVTIPKGFVTDFASIPRALWTIFPPQYAAYVEPAIIHDYFYRCKNSHDRMFADDILYYALVENGVKKSDASKFYFGVRTFGAASYRKDLICA